MTEHDGTVSGVRLSWEWDMGQRVLFRHEGRLAYYFLPGIPTGTGDPVVRWLDGDGGPELDEDTLTELCSYYMQGPHGAGWRDGKALRPKRAEG